MQKLAVNEAAEILGITKEAVYNRIRRGSLKTVIENGTKFVILDEEPSSEKPTKTAPKSTKPIKIGFLKKKSRCSSSAKMKFCKFTRTETRSSCSF